MATGILKVKGEQLVDGEGNVVILRGAGIGGWMNMENFITGYPAHEHEHRAAMLKVLGKESYEYFFDKWLEYYFTEKDAKFFASLGLNCIRIPFNHRHFMDDMNPGVLKVEGFKHLDRVIKLCADEKIYTILDLHTTPGGQNPDHQDRVVWLWEQIAARYKGNPWIAGYNPMNEPCDPEHWRLPAFYDRLEPAIRKIDPDHVLWLDGNTFAMEWKYFDHVLPNSVYALHDYSMMGFPTGERFKATADQKSKLERQFIRKAEFMTTHKTPIWNGEFGPVYSDPRIDSNAEEINQDRFSLLSEQLSIYDKYQIHWSIWLYKDIGVQGMVHTSPDSKWNKLIQPFLEKKRYLQLDAWGKYPSKDAEEALNPLVEWIDKQAPNAKDQYPTPWATERHVLRSVIQTFFARCFSDEFAEQFRGKTKEELDALAHSFHFDECVQREGLNKAMREHATVESKGERAQMVLTDEEKAQKDDLP